LVVGRVPRIEGAKRETGKEPAIESASQGVWMRGARSGARDW